MQRSTVSATRRYRTVPRHAVGPTYWAYFRAPDRARAGGRTRAPVRARRRSPTATSRAGASAPGSSHRSPRSAPSQAAHRRPPPTPPPDPATTDGAGGDGGADARGRRQRRSRPGRRDACPRRAAEVGRLERRASTVTQSDGEQTTGRRRGRGRRLAPTRRRRRRATDSHGAATASRPPGPSRSTRRRRRLAVGRDRRGRCVAGCRAGGARAAPSVDREGSRRGDRTIDPAMELRSSAVANDVDPPALHLHRVRRRDHLVPVAVRAPDRARLPEPHHRPVGRRRRARAT